MHDTDRYVKHFLCPNDIHCQCGIHNGIEDNFDIDKLDYKY